MAEIGRKSIATVLHERHGGIWTFDRHTNNRWICDDGRIVKRKLECTCWMFGIDKKHCRCPVNYILVDDNGERIIDVSDPRVYRLNGMSTKPR